MLTLKTYRRAAVPILAVQTPDAQEVLRLALKECQNGTTSPVLQWDCMHGLIAANNEALELEASLNANQEPAIFTGNPIEFLRVIESLGDADVIDCQPIVVAFGLGAVLLQESMAMQAIQALLNLRDCLSQTGALLVLTVPVGWINPLPNDIAVDASALPDAAALKAIATRLCKDAKIEAPSDDASDKIVDALTGLSGFAAEQAVALSLTKDGINLESLRTRKRQQISETPGLSVYTGQERFADLGGLGQAKKLFGQILTGKRRPGGIVFIDEIEKAMGGASGDTSGVSLAILKYMLTYMQDQRATGSIFVGPPGAAKSAFSKAMGAEADVPTISLDLGGIKGGIVGQSESQMRAAFEVITAVTGGRPFFVATSNNIETLPPELIRRFTIGTMFFDLPTADERGVIWDLYIKSYDLGDQTIPESDGWTGAEIRQCADMADRLGVSLLDAARYVVPVSISSRESITRLRQAASGRYLSASNDGVYTMPMSTGGAVKRNVNLS